MMDDGYVDGNGNPIKKPSGDGYVDASGNPAGQTASPALTSAPTPPPSASPDYGSYSAAKGIQTQPAPSAEDVQMQELHASARGQGSPTRAFMRSFLPNADTDTTKIATGMATPKNLALGVASLHPIGRAVVSTYTAGKGIQEGGLKAPFNLVNQGAKAIAPETFGQPTMSPEELQNQTLAASGIAAGASGMRESIPKAAISAGNAANSISNRLNNAAIKTPPSSIEPATPGYRGVNAGRGLSDNSISGMSKESIAGQVGDTLKEQTQQLSEAAQNADRNVVASGKPVHIDVRADLAKPFQEALSNSAIDPNLRSQLTNRYQQLLDNPKYDLSNMTRNDLLQLKRDIGETANFNSTDPIDVKLNPVIRKVYNSLNRRFESEVPGAAKLNQSVSDLIEAQGASTNSVRGKQAGIGGHSAFTTAKGLATSAPVMTGAARAIKGAGDFIASPFRESNMPEVIPPVGVKIPEPMHIPESTTIPKIAPKASPMPAVPHQMIALPEALIDQLRREGKIPPIPLTGK